MTFVRPVVEASVGGVVALTVAVANAVDIAAQAVSSGPGVIFGADTIWQWSLVLAAAALVWRASKLVTGIEEAMKAFQLVQTGHHERILENEKKWRHWEPLMIQLRMRYLAEPPDRSHG